MDDDGQGAVGGPPSGARGSYAKGRKRRAEILQAALVAFGTVGYREASLTQIAADCGVTRAGLVHHFASKEALLQEVLAERDRADVEQFFLGSDPRGDGADYFARLVRVIEHNADHPGIVSLYAVLSAEATDPSHPAHEYFVARYEALRGSIRAALAQASGRGLVHAGARIEGLDVELIALMDGLQEQWLLDPNAIDMAASLRARLAEILAVPLD